MAVELQLPSRYYDLQTSQRMDFRDYMAQQATMGANISSGLGEVKDSIVQMHTGIQTAVNVQTLATIASTAVLAHTFNEGFDQINNTLDMGFCGISSQLGAMTASFSMGLDRVSDNLKQMSKDICDRLDAIHDITNNPLLTQSRELYRRAVVRYNKGLFEEALEDVKAALEKDKTEYMSWFLEGKIYLFGAGKFSNVIDLDLAISALTDAAKYIDSDIAEAKDARLMAAEIYFYWGIAQYAKSNDLLRADKKAEASDMLMRARKTFEQSFQYSGNMYESLYNVARCKALQGEVDSAIKDLETLVRKDRNYCIRVYTDGDFSGVEGQFANLILKLKREALMMPSVIRIQDLLSELSSIGGITEVKLPSAWNEELPYFDILDYDKEFSANIILLKRDIAVKKCEVEAERKIRHAEEERERQEKAEAAERKRREAEEKRRQEEEQRRIEQSNRWASQGLCRYCGGKLGGVFTKKCKSCGREG